MILDPRLVIAQVEDVGAAPERGDPMLESAQFVFRIGTSLRIEAAPRSIVRGRVVGEAGEPVRFQRVQLRALGEPRRVGPPDADGMFRRVWPARAVTRTGRDGAFEFVGHWPAGEACAVTVASEPDETSRTRVVQVAVGDRLEGVELVLPRTGEVAGRVVDAAGQPVAGATVELLTWSMTDGRGIQAGTAWARSDREGRYRFLDVTAGRQLLTGRLGGLQPVFSGEHFVVKSGERVERPIRIE